MSSPTSSTAPAGRIHDIGYRHYEGPRLGRAYILRSLYVHNLRSVYGIGRPVKSKFFPFLLSIFMLVPAAGSIAVVAITGRSELLIPYSTYGIALQLLVAIFLASQSPVVAARELRSHTVPLYFSRPVRSADYVLAKYGALATSLFLLMAAPITLLYAGSLVTKVPHPMTQLGHYLLGLVGCVLFALVLAAVGLLIAAYAPRRGFGVAAVMAVYLVTSAMVLILQGLAYSRGDYGLQGWMALFQPFTLVDVVQVNLLGGRPEGRMGAAGALGGVVALAFCAMIVAGALALLYGRFRKAGR